MMHSLHKMLGLQRYRAFHSQTAFSEMTQKTAVTPFKVTQGHWFLYQPKARMRLPVSDYY